MHTSAVVRWTLLASLLLPCVLAGAPAEDLLLGRAVQGEGLSGTPSIVTAGVSRPEGEAGGPANSAVLAGTGSFLVVDLGEVRSVAALLFQLDADDAYMIQGSANGELWTGLVRVEAGVEGGGLRTRTLVLPQPVRLRFVGVHAESGVGGFHVARLSAYASVPDVFAKESPPTLAAAVGDTEDGVLRAKALIAAAGAALLAWGAWLGRRGRARAHARLRDALLGALGVLGLAAFWNFGRFRPDGYVHRWDVFHYFLGAKYQPELGYTHLYECAAAAEAETRGAPPGGRVVTRDLVTNTLGPLDVPRAAEVCRTRFDEARWRAFVADASWFRERLPAEVWHRMLQDHGYNATPAWEILGGLLARTGAATDARIGFLAAIDSVLLLAMWGVVVWAFGWRAAAVAAIFWGTNYPGRFDWTGGAFLRMDWLVCVVVGICLLKKERPAAAGALLTFAALLRIFPGVVLAGLGLAILAGAAARRRLPDAFARRIAWGAAASAAIALPLSLVAAGGGAPRGSAWREFAGNARKHLATPLTNNMGLTTLISYRPEMRAERLRTDEEFDPFERWKVARLSTMTKVRPIAVTLIALSFAAFAWAFRERPPWVAAAAAVGFVPIAADLTCYYHACLLALALLVVIREEIGVWMLALAAVSGVVPMLLGWDEDRYVLLTAVELAVVASVWWIARGDRIDPRRVR